VLGQKQLTALGWQISSEQCKAKLIRMISRLAYNERYRISPQPLIDVHGLFFQLLVMLRTVQVDRTLFMEVQDRKADTPYVDAMERQLRTALSEQASCVAEKADRQTVEAMRDTHHLEMHSLQTQVQALTSGLARLDDRVRVNTRNEHARSPTA
jgi:hypothetical protein